ncbi:hypothetical protein CDAR_480731 [Caerostris darwini]|uniref:Uncharacterized protein n=1 Tax=Caerostris darwini TaxID=1538125 RepID=A0AAV4S1M7_9ARAC|nr:hypothetical protein CDAR_480731 [Caerostris darwini]
MASKGTWRRKLSLHLVRTGGQGPLSIGTTTPVILSFDHKTLNRNGAISSLLNTHRKDLKTGHFQLDIDWTLDNSKLVLNPSPTRHNRHRLPESFVADPERQTFQTGRSTFPNCQKLQSGQEQSHPHPSASYKHRNFSERTVHRGKKDDKKCSSGLLLFLLFSFFAAEAAVKIDRAIKIARSPVGGWFLRRRRSSWPFFSILVHTKQAVRAFLCFHALLSPYVSDRPFHPTPHVTRDTQWHTRSTSALSWRQGAVLAYPPSLAFFDTATSFPQSKPGSPHRRLV